MRNNIIPICAPSPEEIAILNKTIQECAEVIQCCTKILDFGFESTNPENPGLTNRQHLEVEVGDTICLFDLLVTKGIVKHECVSESIETKKIKLRKYSNIEV